MYEDSEANVGRIFRNAYQPVKPIILQWRDTEVTITEIGFSHTLTQGSVIRHVFSCTDGITFYQLTFNHTDIPMLAKQLRN